MNMPCHGLFNQKIARRNRRLWRLVELFVGIEYPWPCHGLFNQKNSEVRNWKQAFVVLSLFWCFDGEFLLGLNIPWPCHGLFNQKRSGLWALKASFQSLCPLLFCDSVGIRTQDPQLRRLLLYPTELRNQIPCIWLSSWQITRQIKHLSEKSVAKLILFSHITKNKLSLSPTVESTVLLFVCNSHCPPPPRPLSLPRAHSRNRSLTVFHSFRHQFMTMSVEDAKGSESRIVPKTMPEGRRPSQLGPWDALENVRRRRTSAKARPHGVNESTTKTHEPRRARGDGAARVGR